tara:strand:+ start:2427 stop:2645 length:219 start_codon:yes stop_codon:yes gene_type:complete
VWGKVVVALRLLGIAVEPPLKLLAAQPQFTTAPRAGDKSFEPVWVGGSGRDKCGYHFGTSYLPNRAKVSCET